MPDTLLRIADPTVGVVLGTCGAVISARRRQSLIGPLLLLACGSWFVGSVWGLALFLHRGPLIHVHISYPTGRTHRMLALATVTGAYLTAIVEAIARNPWVTLTMAIMVALAASDIYTRTSGPARKAGAPALGAALAFAAVLALSAANQLLLWQDDRLIVELYDLVICVVALVLTADLLSGRWTEAVVADFVSQLGDQTDTGALAAAIRRVLGDPTAQIGFWLTDQRRYVDDRGAPFEPSNSRPDRSIVEIDDHGLPAALLVHDAAAPIDQRLISEVTTALRVALANTRLRADVQAHVVELSRVRRRLVEAADQQRRQLQTDLAQGPQHRLSEVAHLLGQAADNTVNADLSERLHAAQTEVTRAKVELSELTIGIRPADLESGGLAAALPLLVNRTPTPQVLLQVTAPRLPPAIEGAIYFVCAEALTNVAKHAQATQAVVEVSIEHETAVARIADDGIGGVDPAGSGLRGLRDRAEALDGRLTVTDSGHGGTLIEARLPLAPQQVEEST